MHFDIYYEFTNTIRFWRVYSLGLKGFQLVLLGKCVLTYDAAVCSIFDEVFNSIYVIALWAYYYLLFVFSCLIKFCSMQICLCWKMLLATVLKSQNRKNLSSLRKRKAFSILKPFKLFKEHVTEEIGADYSDYHIIFQDIEKILQLMILPMIQFYGK